MEFKIKHGVVLGYFLLVLYACTMVPFVFQEHFYEETNYVVAMTVVGSLLVLTSLASNGITCYILVFCYNHVEESTNFLFVLISIADLFLPFLRYPIEIADLWIFKKKLYMDMNYKPFKKATARFAASHHGVAATSALAFTLVCIIRFFQAFRTRPFFRIKTSWKFAATLLLAATSLVVGIVNYRYVEEEWFHAFQAPLVMFFPLFVMASTLIAGFIKTELLSTTSFDEGSTGRLLAIYCIFLSYMLLWTPSFTLDMLHNYCCTMDWVEKERAKVIVDNLLHFKTCLNGVFLYVYDEKFRRIFNVTLRAGGSKKNATFAQTFNEQDISIRYTVNDEEMMIDLEQQALVS